MTPHAGVVEVVGILMVIVSLGTLLTYLEIVTRNPARYSGRTFDPQRPVTRRAGTVGYTGMKCPLCGATTFGNSPRCGKCGRLNVQPRMVPTESTRRLSLVEKQ